MISPINGMGAPRSFKRIIRLAKSSFQNRLHSKSRVSPSAIENSGYAAAIRAAQPHDHKVRNSELSN